MIDSHPFYPVISKIRPEIKVLEGSRRLQAFSEVFGVLYLLPFAIIGIIWLIIDSASYGLPTEILPLAFLSIGILITNNQTAAIYVELGSQGRLALTSSLGSILFWAGVLLWGPVMLWANLIIDTLSNLYGSWRVRRLNQNAFWGPFTSYLHSLAPIIGTLFSLMIYKVLGGTLPFTSTKLVDWYLALIAIFISSVFPGLILLPIFHNINILTGNKSTLAGNARFIFSAIAFNLLPGPFGIPVALLFVKAGMVPFTAMLSGVVLVNLLAYHLSQLNQRNMQQSRELAQLEKLGEEIIQSQPDGSTLKEILEKYLASMFSSSLDIVEVQIFDDVHLPGFSDQNGPLRVVHPNESIAQDISVWDALRKSDDDFLVLKNQIPHGFKVIYGDAILVKINSASPTANGEQPACIGGIYLLMNKSVARTIDSLSSVQALASQISSALYRAQVHAETLAAEKMSQELAFAGRIQASFLPEFIPNIEGWSIAASLTPARQTSGDFYDFIEFKDGKVGFLVADVADKGTGAALYMALSRTLIRTFALHHPDQPAEALRLANERILEDSRADQFVTVFYGVLDPATSTLTYCNAGHNPPYLFSGENGQEPITLTRTGMALGAMEGMFWEQKTTRFEKGDLLLAFSDGVTEAQNSTEEFFGEDNLIYAGKLSIKLSSDEILEKITETLNKFVGSAPQFDDITLMVLKRQ